MNEHVLVSGGAGYVGRQVVEHLLQTGRRVTTLSRNTGLRDCPWIQADLSDSTGVASALRNRSFDWVMHLASLPGDTGNPTQMTEVNVNGCLNLLEFCRSAGVSRFLLASSISAYGWYPGTPFDRPDHLPVSEEHLCRPKDMYSTTKRVQELMTLTYFHQYQLPVTILRLTAVVGPKGQGGGRTWREFARQLAEGQRVQIPHFSVDEQCHYVDVRDVARMFAAAAQQPAAVGQVFNCAGPSPTRGSEFVEIVRGVVPDIDVELGFPWSMAQGNEVWFDMTKAKALIQFEPAYALADSITSIRDWISAGGLQEQVSDQLYAPGVGHRT